MPAKRKSPARKTAATSLVITRIFAAPRSLVFAAWTQKKHLVRWSAPKGLTIPTSEADLRPGGRWRACMLTPDGSELWLGGVYREIVKNELLVFTHAWEEDGKSGHETIVTVRFLDHGTGTKMIFEQSGFDSTASRKGHQGGWQECFDKLAALLATTPVGAASRARKSVRRKIKSAS